MKKYCSFVIILLILSLISLTIWQDKFAVFFQNTNNTAVNYAYAAERSGSLYHIYKDDNGLFLRGIDSAGEQFFSKNITGLIYPDNYVDALYIDNDKNFVLTTYQVEEATGWIHNAGVHMLREDGTYYAQLYNENASYYKDSRFRSISAIAEDDRYLYYGVMKNNNEIGTYLFDKTAAQKIETNETLILDGGEQNPSAFCILPNMDIVLGMPEHIIVKSGKESKAYELGHESCIERFFYSQGTIFFHDAINGGIYSSSVSVINFMPVIGGNSSLADEENAHFSDLQEISVNSAGTVTGVLRTPEEDKVYSGGAVFLPAVAQVARIQDFGLNDALIIAAVVVGVLLASILLWDFYTSMMKMRLPILIRQTLLIFLTLYTTLYFSTTYVLIPNMAAVLERMQRNNLLSMGNLFISSLEGANETPGMDGEGYGSFIDIFSKLFAQGALIETEEKFDLYRIFVYTGGEDPRIAISNEGYGGDYPLERLLSGYQVSDISEKGFLEYSDETGRKMALVVPTAYENDGMRYNLCIIGSLSRLDRSLDLLRSETYKFLIVTGASLALILIGVELYTLINIKRIKTGVEEITRENYNMDISVKSGDELEELAVLLNDLKRSIKSKTQNLMALNAAYLPFIPQRFLEILGCYNMDGISKELNEYKKNVYLIFLRFHLDYANEDASNTFEIINKIFEELVPIVNSHQGTVFNFLYNGFDAVFEENADTALSAALKIRDAQKAINSGALTNYSASVDIRIVLAKTNAIFGFIGDQSRMQPVAISEALSVSDIIAKLCFESDIYIASIYRFNEDLDKDSYTCRRIGAVEVNESMVELFDLFDSDPNNLHQMKTMFQDKFQTAVGLFERKDYGGAKSMFMDIIKHSSEDGAVRHYMYLSDYNLVHEEQQNTFTSFKSFHEKNGRKGATS